jgi:hypothetical protein
MQLFRAKNPAGPWTRTELNRSFRDLSALFDTDGKIYVIWGYQGIIFLTYAHFGVKVSIQCAKLH